MIKYIKYFKLSIFFIFFINISIFTYAADIENTINTRFTGKTINLVDKDSNNIIDTYKDHLLWETKVPNIVSKWDTFIKRPEVINNTSLVGEIAAKVFFETNGYKILQETYNNRKENLLDDQINDDMYKTISCTSKKGPDNGIDGVFIPLNMEIDSSDIVIINESKFRSGRKNLTSGDFGFVKSNGKYAHNVQQSHSYWNRDRFDDIPCVGDLKYKDRIIIRTATFLNNAGELKLYEIRDTNGNQGGNTLDEGYPSSWNKRTIGGRAFNLLIK